MANSRKHGNAATEHEFFIGNIRAAALSARGLWLDYPSNAFANYREDFAQKPGLASDLVLADASGGAGPTAAAFLAAMIANKNFCVAGTNMTTALCTFAVGTSLTPKPGITLNTAGADADQAILVPNTNTSVTAWNQSIFTAAGQLRFRSRIRTGGKVAGITTAARTTTTASITTASNHNLSIGQSVTIALLTGPSGYAALNGTYVVVALTSATVFTYTTTTSGTVSSGAATGSVTTNNLKLQTIWTGLKKTSTPVIATDDDQFYARFLPTENSGQWQIVTSRAGVDLVTVLPITVQPSTIYDFVFTISDLGLPVVRVNGVLYKLDGTNAESGDLGNAALTATVPLFAFTGTSANGTTPGRKAIDVLPGYEIQAIAA